MRERSERRELLDIHVGRDATAVMRVWVEETTAPRSEAAMLARVILLVAYEMGLLNFAPHEFGQPLSPPLSVYGPVERGNLRVALSLELRYFLDAIKRRNVAGTVQHLRRPSSLCGREVIWSVEHRA